MEIFSIVLGMETNDLACTTKLIMFSLSYIQKGIAYRYHRVRASTKKNTKEK